jgi:hypothetical protein
MVAPVLRRLSALVVLVALGSSILLPLAGGLHTVEEGAGLDPLWSSDPHAVAHRSTTQVERVRDPLATDHCAVCHLQRTMAGADDDAKRLLTAGAGAVAWLIGQSAAPLISQVVASWATRGPPVLS